MTRSISKAHLFYASLGGLLVVLVAAHLIMIIGGPA